MTVVACLGDSITEGSPYWDSRHRTGNPEGQWEHGAQLRHPELGPGRMKLEWTDPDGDHPSIAGYRRLGELAFRLP